MLKRGWTLLGLFIPVVIAITAAAHWPAPSAHALWLDDNQYLTENMLVQQPSWSSAGQFLSEVFTPSTVQGYYQPLTMISLMLDVAMGGNSEHLRPFHRTSLILHLANTALVILLFYSLFGNPWIAAATGLLFGLHPLTVEPIPWVGERKTLLAAFFAFIAMTAYVRYVGARDEGRETRKSWYISCFICYLLALMSKPTTTPLPLLMLLLDYWPLGRLSWKSVREKAPFFILAVIFAIITVISQARTADITLPQEYPRFVLPMFLCHNLVFYLYKLVWPVHLVPYYIASLPLDLTNPIWRWSLIGAAALLIGLAVSWRWTRVLVTSWLFFFIAIFPTLGVIGFTGVIASDKYAYLPMVGLLLAVAWGMCRCRTITSRAVLAVVLLAAVAAEFRLTRRAHHKWQDSLILYERVLEVAPGAGIVHNNIANLLMRRGQTDRAIEHYQLAMQYAPKFAPGYHNYGRAIADRGRVAEAIPYYQEALRIKPDYPQGLLDLATALYQTGQAAAAIKTYRELIDMHPDHAAAHHNLANVLSTTGQIDEAIAHYRQALALQTTYPEAHINLANALVKKARFDEAMLHFREGLRLNPDWYYAHYSLADAFTAQGKTGEAIAVYRQAIRLKSDYAAAHNDLANALAKEGDVEGAITELREAVRLDPKYVKALFNLATLLLQKGQDAEAVKHYEQVLEHQPEYPTAHSNLGAALERLGRLAEALRHYDEAARQKPDYIDARYNKAVVLQRMGRLDEAIAEYEAVLKASPTHTEAKTALDAARAKRNNTTTNPP